MHEAPERALPERVRVLRVVPGAGGRVQVWAHLLEEGRPDVPVRRVFHLDDLVQIASGDAAGCKGSVVLPHHPEHVPRSSADRVTDTHEQSLATFVARAQIDVRPRER